MTRPAVRTSNNSPATRDSSIDRLRVAAVIAVISGHWLVTALVVGDYGIAVTSPLRDLPGPAVLTTWGFQALAPFFCAAGFAATRALAGGRHWRPWFTSRITALLPAVGALVACWAVFLGVLLSTGFSLAEVRSLGKLAIGPLWFLVVLAVLWAAFPVLVALDRRLGAGALAVPAVVVGLDDLARFGGLSPAAPVVAALGVAATVGAWAVPFLFGIRLARGAGPGRVGGLAIALAGAGAMAILIVVAGYPASAVGITGAARSNLTPPSLFVLALAAVQLGLFVVLRGRRGCDSAPSPRIARLNRLALPVFLWHQSALILVLLASAGWLPIFGLVGRPDGYSWVALRLVWFPVLALVLACLVRASVTGRR